VRCTCTWGSSGTCASSTSRDERRSSSPTPATGTRR
jgi:hypothetical protein